MIDSEGPFGRTPTVRLLHERRMAQDTISDEEAGRVASNFLRTVAANLDNKKLSDTEFRDFMRRSMTGMPGVNYNE